jgi:hypothetical protein
MSLKIAILFLACYVIIPVSAIQQPSGMGAQAASSQAATASAAENAQLRQISPRDDAQALRDDIKKMRTLVRQMESNLAFVDTTQSPLKHQFQLDIDMWKVVIDHLERRVQGNAR